MSGARLIAFPAPSPPSDERLLAACAAGERQALGVLFDRHHAVVHRYLVRFAGVDADEAEDLLQATFIEVLGSARRFRGECAVRTWILGVATNLARKVIRGDVRRKRMLRVEEEAPRVGVSTPEADATRAELLGRLQVALAKLSDDVRAAFVMCELEEVRGVEAARVLGVPEGTLYRRLFEARRALRAALGGEEA